MTIGSVEPLKRLHARWWDQVQFLDVLIRHAHPGTGAPRYEDAETKHRSARAYQEAEGIPWPVLVDDVEGTVHQTYGGLSNPTYLIGTDGRVSHYSLSTRVPRLHMAIAALLAAGGRGVVGSGWDVVPHVLGAFVHGWRALARGYPQSVRDLNRVIPGGAALLRFGDRLRPFLTGTVSRSTPLPLPALLARVAAAGVAAALLARRKRRPVA